MQCWCSYSYHNYQYVFGQGDMTCVRSSIIPLIPSETIYPLGKHPKHLMPYKVIPRYGIGALYLVKRHPKTTNLASYNTDEQSNYPSEETERTSDVESCINSCHSESCPGIQICGQQYHAAHSSRTRSHTHNATCRSTIVAVIKGNAWSAVVVSQQQQLETKKEDITCGGDIAKEKIRNYVWRKLSFVYRVFMALVDSTSSESDPVVIYQFSRFWTPRARATDLGQGPHLQPVFTGASCVPLNREQEKRPAGGRAKNADVQIKLIL